jgi:isochorismate hydrolase
MKKFQVIIEFDMDDEFMTFVPAHRTYINHLINTNIIDHYAVSMESQRVWITITAENREQADQYISKSPLYKYWGNYEIEELFLLDGQHYRMPTVQLN